MSDRARKVSNGIKNSAVIKNPVLFEAIGLAPVVAMSVSLKTAIMLSVVSVAELIIIESFACLCLKKLKSSFRVLIYAILGVLINIPIFMFFNHFAPNETANVSIFLPIVAVNSLIALHCERVAVKKGFSDTLIDAFSAGVGYVFIVFIVGTIRELLGSGTIYGIDINLPVKFTALTAPFGGFLVLGFAAALFKQLIHKKYPDEKPESAFNLSEISESHIEGIKDLFEEDFNAFDENEPDDETEKLKFVGKKPVAEKPVKPKKVKKEKKAKKEKKKIEKVADGRKVSEENRQPSAENDSSVVNAERKHRDYVSEFDDLLAELEKTDNNGKTEEKDDKDDKGGDEQ